MENLKDKPAFPSEGGAYSANQKGLTFRQYAAVKALQGLISYNGNCDNKQTLAKQAIEYTDALIAELEK